MLLNEAAGEMRLTGFGIALRLARERQSPHQQGIYSASGAPAAHQVIHCGWEAL
jgi:hypothetical protein